VTYGPIISNEAATPIYQVGGTVSTVNGTAILNVALEVEGIDPAFTPDTDAAFQDLLDRLSGSPYLALGSASKSWRATRSITPTP
jgi:hypothetical protein